MSQDPDFIMNKIRLLTEMPKSDTTEHVDKPQRTTRTKRLKGLTNHDYCDYCDEGGVLVQCEQCPAAFHPLCLNPPCEVHDIMYKNDFYCNQCKFNEKLKNFNPNQPNQIDKINFDVIDNEFPLNTLIRFAKQLNPKQLKLPKSIQTSFQLPGLSKYEWWTKDGNKQFEQKEAKKRDVKDNVMNIPKKTCFLCRKTSRIGQLVKCDFCPLLYHLDCLNPPLCNPPKDLWMCPNHVEHFLDSKLLQTSRLSDRIKLWAKYSSVDSQQVKLDFINKVNGTKRILSTTDTATSSNTSKIKLSKVPDFVKEYYKNPIKIENIYKDIQNHQNQELKPTSLCNGLSSEKPRALLYNLNQDRTLESPSHYMSHNTFKIGKNEDYDLCLDKKCKYISNKHAIIFYDENSNQYELLNYSEYGTIVDNIYYGLDIDNKTCNTVAQNENRLIENKNTKCKCDLNENNDIMKRCWEGSAFINHGSHIKFGCLEFVFCIVDYENV